MRQWQIRKGLQQCSLHVSAAVLISLGFQEQAGTLSWVKHIGHRQTIAGRGRHLHVHAENAWHAAMSANCLRSFALGIQLQPEAWGLCLLFLAVANGLT